MKNFSNFLRENWLIILVLIIPFPVIASYWDQLPDKVPFHWNLKGEVDWYVSKAVGLFFGPVLNIILFFFLLLVKRIDPKGENYELFKSRYRGIRLSIHVFVLAIFAFTILTSLGIEYDFNKAIETAVLLFFIVIGNYMVSIRPNYFVGIRTPWTLSNEEVWRRTHRLTGRVWVIGCLVMLAGVWTLNLNALVILGGITAIALWSVIYSYIIFQKVKTRQNGA